MNDDRNWSEFQRLTAKAPPRPMLLKSLELFNGFTGFAVDLGCGSGIDTIKLINSGWRVCAVDATVNGFENIKSSIPQEKLINLELKQEFFEYLSIPEADLVYSSFSIPFCKPESFDVFWNKIITAIKSGGRFAGNLFGDKDEWSGINDMTFKTQEQVFDLFKELQIEYFNEIYADGPTAISTTKKWHIFEVIAKRGYCKEMIT